MRFMRGRYPQTILTDLDPVLRDVIRSELPGTKHVASICNIFSKLPSWFSLPLGSRYAEFKSEFDALYHLDSVDEFELRWSQMVSMFGLGSDKHIALLFSFRASWALSYMRGYFLAQMASLAYLKTVDAFLKGVFSAQTCLRSFFEQVFPLKGFFIFYFKSVLLARMYISCHNCTDFASFTWIQVGISANFQNHARLEMQYMHIKTCIPIEEHARSILSPFAFNALQNELVLAMQYAITEMANGSYIVRHFKKMDGERLVIWLPEDEQIHCSCKEFESSGILCRHALRVLIIKNYFQLPEKYVLSRWRREISPVIYDNSNTQNVEDEWFREYQGLTETLLAESSITKERSDYVRGELTKELTRLLNEVRNLPETDVVAMDLTLSPTC